MLGLELEEDIDIISDLVYLPISIDANEAVENAIKNRSDLLNQENEKYRFDKSCSFSRKIYCG